MTPKPENPAGEGAHRPRTRDPIAETGKDFVGVVAVVGTFFTIYSVVGLFYGFVVAALLLGLVIIRRVNASPPFRFRQLLLVTAWGLAAGSAAWLIVGLVNEGHDHASSRANTRSRSSSPPAPHSTPSPPNMNSPGTTAGPSPEAFTAERAGPAGSSAFTDYLNAAGPSKNHIDGGSTVYVSCRVQGKKFGKDTWWYRISSAPWANRYYAPADNFFNTADRRKPFLNGILVDGSVPLCH